MTALWMRAAGLAAGFLALQACAMPHSQYAPYEGYQTPAATQPATPQYPVREEPAPPAASADPHDPVAKPTEGVSGAPLPPAAPPGPSSANPTGFLYASTPPMLIRPAFASDWAQTPRLLYAATPKRARAHKSRPAVHVDADGRLESAATGPLHVKIKKGDTIKALAARYGVTKKAIIKANHLKDVTDLTVGAPLIIPASEAGAPETGSTRTASAKASTPKTYKVRHGDTIYGIGRQFGIPPKAIETLNGFTSSTRLHIGQVVKLPRSPQEEEAAASDRREAAHEDAHEAANVRARAHTTVEAPPVPQAGSAFASEQPSTGLVGPVGPAHPVPYASLPGHLATPPERPLVPPVASPVIEPQALAGPPDAQVVLAGRGRFIWPVHGPLLSGFGPKPGGQRSDGLDISAPDGAPVHAAATGDVVYAGDLVPGLGNLVLIKHDDGWITAYAHLSRTEVKIKDHVNQGDEIGQAGETGGAAQPEVYFEIRYAPTPHDKAKPVDPSLLLSSF
jgi:murein DD-endopeptidase MepM/ murein hydrolase activator NlpD